MTRIADHPNTAQLDAMIDTGAGRTVVEKKWLEGLGIFPVTTQEIYTVSSGANPIQLSVYNVDISLTDSVGGVLANNLKVVAADDLSGLGVSVLIGRDILAGKIFSFDGRRNVCALRF
jgi:hypothetical protein